MPNRNAEQAKALFRCLWAYANGVPVICCELRVDERGSLCALQDHDPAIKVAVIIGNWKLDSDPTALNTAYERFVNDGERAEIEWVSLDHLR